jgi:4-hydroxy-3-polyprenylbenzoate decarboxylase
MYRMQIYDHRTAGLHWHPHKVGAEHYRRCEALGQRMPVAVALGSDPATIYAATAPLPEEFDEILFAGFLRRRAVAMVSCRTNDLQVPADAEFVLEGHVEPGERRTEGPFGDHTGYYSLADEYPVFHLTAMSHRHDAIYPATIVGKPPMEDAYLGKATERLFLPLLQLVQPEIVDMDLPIEGVFHDCAIISIRKEYPGHARKIMNAVWGMGQMMFTKFVVVVDEHVDVHDYSEVTWRVFNNVDPARDTVIVSGPLDVLDHSSPTARYGAKMGIDATKSWPDEGHAREWPDELAMDPGVVRRVDERWAEFGLPFS